MSITILNSPETYTPAYNEQWFIADSTNKAQTNFKYVVTTTIDTITQTQKFQKRPNSGYLYFNPQKIAESFVRTKFLTNLNEPTPDYYGIKTVTVVISEEYGSPVSGFAGVTGTYTVWNGAYNAHDFSTYAYTQTSNIKQLTLAPSVSPYLGTSVDKINFNQKYLLKSWLLPFGDGVSGGNPAYQLIVICYDSSGSSIQNTTIYNQYYGSAIFPARYLTNVNCSPYGLNLIETQNPALILGKFDPFNPVIPANTAYYTYQWFNISSNANSIIHEVQIDTFCSNYSRYVVHFLNRLGNFDSFTFNLLSRKTIDKETKEYRKVPFELDGNYNYDYDNWEGDRVNYSTTLKNKITLNSNWITEAQHLWLDDLLRSPKVILEDSSNNLFAVMVSNKSWESKQKANDKVFNLTVDLEYDFQDIRQRG